MKMNAESGLESSVKSYMLRKVEVWHVLTYISVVDCKTSESTVIELLKLNFAEHPAVYTNYMLHHWTS